MENPCLLDEAASGMLQVNTICVVSTLLRDGSPYASAAHFAVDRTVQSLYISLDARSQTAQNLLSDCRVAITVGCDPAVPATLQMRGSAILIESASLEEAQQIFYARFPHSLRYRDDLHTRFVRFTPTWSRYSDMKTRMEFFVRGFAPELLG